MDNPLFWGKPSVGKRFEVDTGGTLTTGLVAYWKMEDSTDFFGTNNGTSTNVTFSAGKVNNGAVFSSGNIFLPTSLPSLTSSWSYNFWIQTTQTTTGAIFSRWVSSSSQRQIHIYTLNGYVSVDIPYVIGGVVTTNTGVNDGNWHMITLTKSGTNWRAYKDGTLNSSITNATAQDANTSGAKMGVDFPSGGAQLVGMLDEFGLWSKQLTDAEITDLYNSGNGQTMIS